LYCVFVLFFFVLCTQCCQFPWIVHFSFPLRYSLTFIYLMHENKTFPLVMCNAMWAFVITWRPSSVVRGSVVCHPLTFHIVIFSSETPQPNELKLGRKHLIDNGCVIRRHFLIHCMIYYLIYNLLYMVYMFQLLLILGVIIL
jgi:hypothetical protein